ncbi:NnrS family protein [Pannonibacter phragmitetus]|uniref:NnrS family protein n=1 Tax=Pannonibacter phragmitetus TaxID=121719 RepID=UPI000E66DE6E|nr:NnrS family protein [Pannonibacter phragmitetus]
MSRDVAQLSPELTPATGRLLPCQPLFLLAGLWAALVPLVWLLPAGWLPERGIWHARELLLGMAGAAAGGYLLTSLPAWTKGQLAPLRVTAGAVLLWGLARGAGGLELMAVLPAGGRITGLANALYFLFVAMAVAVPLARAGTLARTGVAGRGWVAAGLMLAAAAGAGLSGFGHVPAAALMLPFTLLLAYVGGRAVPAFTGVWLSRISAAAAPPQPLAPVPLLPVIAAASLLEWSGWQMAAGWLWLAAAGLVLVRLPSWKTFRTVRYPALFWLHIAYAWLPAAFLLQALALWRPELIDPASARHALTMGAMGGMMMAVMLRPAMRRHDRRLLMTPLMTAALMLVQISALLRVLTAGIAFDGAVKGAALAWVLGWACFTCAFWPAVTGPVPRPAFSARLE